LALGVAAGTTNVSGQSLALNGNINLVGGTRTLSLDNSATLGGQISNGGLTVESSQNRRLTLTASNSYSGPTTVNSGALVVATNGSIASSATTVNGGILDVDGVAGNVTVNNSGRLEGGGTVSALTVASGGTLAPGNSPGTLSVSGNATWSSGGRYEWEINNWLGSQGTNWDFLDIAGTLTMDTTASNFIIDVVSLLATNAAGDVPGFSESSIYTFAIATAAGGISGFNANDFTINTSGFGGSSGSFGGSWAIAQDNNTINLVYTGANYTLASGATAIPEPNTGSLMVLGIGLAGLGRRFRRKQ
jgi:autotransporter-associated beta strand protein